jgi:hypothetical protein
MAVGRAASSVIEPPNSKRCSLPRRPSRDVDSVPMARTPAEWPFLERLAFLIEIAQYPVENRARLISERGLTIAQVEAWRVEAQQRLHHLPAPRSRAIKPR